MFGPPWAGPPTSGRVAGITTGRQVEEHVLWKDDDSFQAFHLLIPFLFFPITWGICFLFRTNSKDLNPIHECTLRAR